MHETDADRLRAIDAELRTIAREGFTTMHEYVVRFGFGERGLVYQTVMEAGSPRQAELSFRRRYFREANLHVHSIWKSSSRGRPYDPYILAVQAGVISREEHGRRAHDPSDPVKIRRGGPDLGGLRFASRPGGDERGTEKRT